MTYKAFLASFFESGSQKGNIEGMAEIDSIRLLNHAMEKKQERIVLEFRGYALDDVYEGLLITAPKDGKYIIEGYEQDTEKIRSANSLQITIWNTTGFPTIHWQVLVEWSSKDNSWKATQIKRNK